MEKTILEVFYNTITGSSECWIARIDKDTKENLSFVEPVEIKGDEIKGSKVYELDDGYYRTLSGLGLQEKKTGCYEIKEGNIIKIDDIG